MQMVACHPNQDPEECSTNHMWHMLTLKFSLEILAACLCSQGKYSYNYLMSLCFEIPFAHCTTKTLIPLPTTLHTTRPSPSPPPTPMPFKIAPLPPIPRPPINHHYSSEYRCHNEHDQSSPYQHNHFQHEPL